MKRKVSALLLAVMLLVSLTIPASAAFDPASKDSVVVVAVCLDLDVGETLMGRGSGFFIGKAGEDPTYLVTNYHVISDFVDFKAGERFTTQVQGVQVSGRAKIRVYYDSKNYEEAYPVEYNETKDVAVLKLAGSTSLRTPIALCSPDASMVGSNVYAVGYPGIGENELAAATSAWGIDDVSVTSGTLSRVLVTQGTGQVNLQIDCDIRSGNSGGPLINDDGQVIGINTWSAVSTSDQLNYAVSIDEVLPLLIANGIPYQMAGDVQEADTPVMETVPVEEPGLSTGVIVAIAGGAVAVIAVIVILVLNSKKKKAKAAAAAQVVQPPVVVPVRVAYARSLSAQHGGMRVAVQNQPVLIGRSRTDCAISFAENTPGVSGRHCSVSWDGSSFVLTDLRSSYGTFLQNGQKLTPGVPYQLQPGSSFWLGDKQNLLRVELE